jgi:transcriptional regulator with XRE-family HTH domain
MYEGEQLIRELQRRGWTFARIAAAAGVSDRTISDFARGRRAPSVVQLEKLRQLKENTP